MGRAGPTTFWQQQNHTQPVTGTGWMAVDVVVGDARVTIVVVVRMLRREVKNLVKNYSTSPSGSGSASGSAEEILAKSVDNPFHSSQLAGVSRNPYSR